MNTNETDDRQKGRTERLFSVEVDEGMESGVQLGLNEMDTDDLPTPLAQFTEPGRYVLVREEA